MTLYKYCRMILACTILFALAGCAAQRIAISEKFGYAKREQLVDRVQDARDGQVAAKQQFESALKEFLTALPSWRPQDSALGPQPRCGVG